MHGRVKTITSKEKQERTKKENLLKLEKYQKGCKFLLEHKEISKIQVQVEASTPHSDENKENHEEKEIVPTEVTEKNKKISQLQEKMLKISEQILLAQPDLSVAWNIRRNLAYKLDIDNELNLTFTGLMSNPKSYQCWFNRRWCLDNLVQDDQEKIKNLLQTELQNTNFFLQKDGRNFHCWDHRRWLVKKMKISIEEEIKFSQEMINFNFSNHSAWHYRSTLLIEKYGLSLSPSLSSSENTNIIQEEIDYVTNAFYVDPYDSAGWIYYDWLLSLCDKATLEQQIKSLKELDEIEPDCKYVIIHLLNLMEKLGLDQEDLDQKQRYTLKLVEIDPNRRNYYLEQ